MSTVGHVVGAGAAVVLLPVLPFVLAAYAWCEFTSDSTPEPSPDG